MMFDQIKAIAEKLKSLQGKFDPLSLSPVGNGPNSTLTVDQLNKLQEVAEELRSTRKSLEELIGIIDECDPARMEELAGSNKLQDLSEFEVDAYQDAAFNKYYNGDNKDATQQSASETAVEKLEDLIEDAKLELQEINQLVEAAVKHLDGVD